MQLDEQRRHLHLPSSSECCTQCGTDASADIVTHPITHTTFDHSGSHVFSHTFFVVKVADCFPYASDDAGTHPTANSDANGITNCDASANTCIDTTTDTLRDASAHDAGQRLLLAGFSWLGCSLQLLEWQTVVR